MAKPVLRRYEDSGIALAVKAWLERVGIDPKQVVGWKINQHVGDLSQIELIMNFDDKPSSAPAGAKHATCIEVTPAPGAPAEYVCGSRCPTDLPFPETEQGE